MVDPIIPTLTIPQEGVLIKLEIPKTQALLENQGYTYNQAGFTYNQIAKGKIHITSSCELFDYRQGTSYL